MTTKLKENRLRPDVDSRELCFSQGKPCIYESETDPNILVAEWPNGVIQHKNIPTQTVVRFWPDGRKETFAAGSAEDRRYPHIR